MGKLNVFLEETTIDHIDFLDRHAIRIAYDRRWVTGQEWAH